jgi:hypothetical protein
MPLGPAGSRGSPPCLSPAFRGLPRGPQGREDRPRDRPCPRAGRRQRGPARPPFRSGTSGLRERPGRGPPACVPEIPHARLPQARLGEPGAGAGLCFLPAGREAAPRPALRIRALRREARRLSRPRRDHDDGALPDRRPLLPRGHGHHAGGLNGAGDRPRHLDAERRLPHHPGGDRESRPGAGVTCRAFPPQRSSRGP